MMKNLGPNVFSYGYPAPVLMVGTYNDDGTVNVMNLHECTRTNAGDLALCIGPRSKTHENIKKRRAFTVALVNKNLIKEVDYFGIVSGHRVPDKFEKTGLKAVKSERVNAPIIEGSPLVIECELIEVVRTNNFTTVLARIVNVAADESVLDKTGRIDAKKTGMLFFDSFSNSYFSLGEKAGNAWVEGKKYL
ncbi:flavin reductase family protein [Clostridium chromiireducens]|uniref:Flavoredoxin n=2 Tax=Clostridium TaxID=1485 RepID=A0A1V4IIR9_9CLOT|nr:flavin reductase family protein [Clostridium chromiireducens]OPJ59843.1 flavoredoxin [Clostridium chromiireducens]